MNDAGVLGKRIKLCVPSENVRWLCSWKTHQVVCPKCKPTIAVFLENAFNRWFHLLINDASCCRNTTRRDFHVHIYDGDVMGKRIKSWFY